MAIARPLDNKQDEINQEINLVQPTSPPSLPSKPHFSTTLRLLNHAIDYSVLTAIMVFHLDEASREKLAYLRYPLFSGAAVCNVIETGFAGHAAVTNPNKNTISRFALSFLLSPAIVTAVVGALAELPKFDVAAPGIFITAFGINSIYISIELAQAIDQYNNASNQKEIDAAKQLILDKSIGLASAFSIGVLLGALMLAKEYSTAPVAVAITGASTAYTLYKLGRNLVDRHYCADKENKEKILIVVPNPQMSPEEIQIDVTSEKTSLLQTRQLDEEDKGCLAFIGSRLSYFFNKKEEPKTEFTPSHTSYATI